MSAHRTLRTAYGGHWHRPFFIALPGGVIAVIVSLLIARGYPLEAGLLGFFVTYIGFAWSHTAVLTPAFMKANAEETDEPPVLILFITIMVVVLAVVTVFLDANRPGGADVIGVALGLCALLFGWLTVHTMMGLHYAHAHYRPEATEDGAARATRAGRGGLAFAKTPDPCGSDFLYHSLTIGMTAQVSDVIVQSSAMRRMVMIHATVSFLFNTVIVAAAVNVVVALGK